MPVEVSGGQKGGRGTVTAGIVIDLDPSVIDFHHQLRLAPLSRLVMCSDGVPGMESSPASKGHERLGGRSPLSRSIAISVAQPGVLESCIPSAIS
jgi:hypothetical protein